MSGFPVAYNGTLVVTNTGAALAVGDTLKLFDASSYSGAFTLVSQTPGQTVTWNTANLTVDGTISVASVMAGAAAITFSSTGTTLNLSWPPEQSASCCNPTPSAWLIRAPGSRWRVHSR